MKTITHRETEVLSLIAFESTIDEIAHTLHISHHTVISHRKNLLKKMGVRNTAGLIRRAFEVGVLQVSQS
jgi:DNA-binding CsgD family transcriptional regulator